ncbi:hypothetical protein RB195_007766 [Necator americanus]|uniref:Uncharacterized protein n=1 Tax=Necator americanus TaxID=51031 RepID=A0ABR1BYY3_NECAM
MGHSCRPRHRLVKKACARGAPAVQPCSYEFSISRDSHCFAFCIFGMSKLVLRYRAESGASGLPGNVAFTYRNQISTHAPPLTICL